jgi:hypothetical protein
MKKKATTKSSSLVSRNQLQHLKRQLRVEAALERIRAKTMRMRKSDDLSAVAILLFKELRKLGGELLTCGFVLCDARNADTEQWLSLPGVDLLPPFNVSAQQDKYHRAMYRAWKTKKRFSRVEIHGKDL